MTKNLVIGGVYLFFRKSDDQNPTLMILDEINDFGIVLVAFEDQLYEYGFLIAHCRIRLGENLILVSKNESLPLFTGKWEKYSWE